MVVNLIDEAGCAQAIGWWEALTGSDGEGMPVKPRDFVSQCGKGLLQATLKVRDPEYLRMIHGSEYDAPDNLAQLRLEKF